ncbi:MAG: S8 family serine peptidase [Cytophagaceae bacterium]|nr:S8 family serine peptidase [Cytophagaceae bacterium]MBK9933972.1 S8 family serine peptidase [Cytophagaceae bacterium]MBL0327361.1 S8 family serine peptidase [Cytophagaceae bacterium]
MKKIYTLIILQLVLTNLFSQNQFVQYSTQEYYIKIKQISKKSDKSYSLPLQVNISEELPFLLSNSAEIKSVVRPFYTSSSEILQSIYRITLTDKSNQNKFINDIKNSKDVEYIEPVPIFKTIYTPNDPGISSLYHLDKLKAYQAWDITKGATNITIGIVDDAVQINHPDLANNIVPGWDIVDNDNDPSPPSLSYDHGTHVAGIAGAVSDNNIGVASISMNKGKIMGVRASNSPGYITHGFEGVSWAANNGAKIINMSWGGGAYSITGQQVMNDAFNQGVILVAAAGNSSTNSLHYPSAYDNVLAVASTTNTDQLSYFSNFGTWIDISAPGSGIYSTVPFDAYDTYSGTSMASPLTAGALAFIWSVKSNLNASQIIEIMKNTADNIDVQNPTMIGQLGAGRINLLKAISCSDFSAVVSPFENQIICSSGSSVLLTANSVPDATYQWYKNTIAISGATGMTLDVNTSGNYFVQINKSTCGLNSNVVEVQVMPENSFNLTSSRTPATLCNDSFTLTAPLISGASYTWKKNGTIIEGSSTNILTVDQTGSYEVEISKQGCSSVTSTSISVTGLNLSLSPSGSVTLCSGESQLLSLPSNPNAIFQWKNGSLYIGNNTNTLIVNQPGVYSCVVTTSECGSTTSQVVNVGVIPNTINISTSGSPIICVNSGVNINAPLIVGAKYQWKKDGINIGLNQNTLLATTGGVYQLFVSKADGNCLVTSQTIVIEHMNTNVNITPLNPVTICNGESVTLKTNVLNGVTYSWKKNDVIIGAGSDSISVNESGSYKVIVSRFECHIESPIVTVSIIPDILPLISSGSTFLCQGNYISLQTTSFQGMNYNWKKNNIEIPNSNNSIISVNSPGKYVVTLSHPNRNCSITSDTLNINEIRNTLNIVNNQIGTICSGDSLLISSTAIPGAIYKWQKNTIDINGATSLNYFAKTSGIYRLKGTLLGCTFYSNSDTLNVSSIQSMPPNNPVNISICDGETNLPLSVGFEMCSQGGTVVANYNGGTIGYDAGQQSGPNPTVIINGLSGGLSNLEIDVTWEKKDASSYNSCGTIHQGGSPYLGEMRINLKAPNGSILTLIPLNYYGGNYAGVINQKFKVGGTSLSTIPVSGVFEPSDSFVSLYGSNPNGVWELMGYDSEGADPLCISAFSVKASTASTNNSPNITWWSTSAEKIGRLGTGVSYLPSINEPGTYTYYAQAQCQTLCPSSRIPVTFTIKPKIIVPGQAPIVTGKIGEISKVSPITLCDNESATLNGTCLSGNIFWSNGEAGNSLTVRPELPTQYSSYCLLNSENCSSSEQSNSITVSLGNSPLVITCPIPGNSNQIIHGKTLTGRNHILNTSKIEFVGEKSISLEPGFFISSETQSVFKANIGSCITPEPPNHTITLQPNGQNGIDAVFSFLAPNNNYGSLEDLLIYSWTQSGLENVSRSVIKFDLSILPPNIVIDSVFLSLYNNPTSAYSGPRDASNNVAEGYFIHRVTSNWDEMAVTWNTRPSFSEDNKVSVIVPSNKSSNYENINVTNLYRDIYNSLPENYGIMLKFWTESPYRSIVLASSDNPNQNIRPKLVIYYRSLN